jgi:hypothetical protein
MRFPSIGVVFFVLVWALIGAVPSLRQPIQKGAVRPSVVLLEQPLPNLEQALQKAPNDPYLVSQQLIRSWDMGPVQPVQQANGMYGYSKSSAPFFRKYDALIAKNPTRLGLLRTRLRLSTRGNIVSTPHTLKNNPVQKSWWGSTYVRPRLGLWMDADQLQLVRDLARRGGKLAPEDAFFPFMEAMALIGLNRYDEALAALQRAGKCTTFNDGAADKGRQDLAFRLSQGPLEWDEKMLVWGGVLFPHFFQLRQLTEEITYSGVTEYKAGRKAEAWRRWNIAYEAASAMRRAETHGPAAVYGGLLVSENLERVVEETILWEVAGYDLRPSKPLLMLNTPQPSQAKIALTRRRIAAAFQRLALREGQPQLATLSRQELASREERRKLPLFSGSPDAFGKALRWTQPQVRAVSQLPWFGWHIFIMAGVGALGFACSLLATRGGRDSRVGKSTVWNLSTFFTALWIGAAVWAATAGAGLETYTTFNRLVDSSNTSGSKGQVSLFLFSHDWQSNFQWFLFLTLAGITLLYFEGQRRAGRETSRPRSSRAFAWHVLQSLVWLFVAVTTAVLWYLGLQRNYSASNDSNPSGFDDFLRLWVGAVIFALVLTWRTQKRGQHDLRTFSIACCTALGLTCSVLMARQGSDTTLTLGALVGIATLVLLAWNLRGPWPGMKNVVAGLPAPIEVCGRVIANLGLALSVAYVVAFLALWPARQEINRNVDSLIQMGEVDWMWAQEKK